MIFFWENKIRIKIFWRFLFSRKNSCNMTIALHCLTTLPGSRSLWCSLFPCYNLAPRIMPVQRTSRGLEIICCFLIIKSDNTSTWAGQALLLGQHWPSGTGAIEPSSHRSTIQRTCSKTHIDTDCLSRKYGLEKRWEILHIFSQSPGSNSCCRTPLCSDNKSLEGSARCLRLDISAHFCGWFKHSEKWCFCRTRNRKIGKWRWLYLWRTGYALAVLQRAKVFGRAAAALGHWSKIAIRAKLEKFLEDNKLGARFWLK